MPANFICALCEPLGSTYVAQTGSGDRFPAAYDKLKKEDLGLRSDLLRCPECDGFFFWEDHSQLFGSGNLDEETLAKLEEQPARIVRDLLRLPDPAISATHLLKECFAGLPESIRDLLLSHLRNSRKEAFDQLLPSLVARLHEANDATLRSFLISYCYDGTIRSAAVLKLIEEDPRTKNPQCEMLADYCRKSLGLSRE